MPSVYARPNPKYFRRRGGATWLNVNTTAGTIAEFVAPNTACVLIDEPELGVLYRVNCSVYSSVSGTTFNYRISTTGPAAASLDVGA